MVLPRVVQSLQWGTGTISSPSCSNSGPMKTSWREVRLGNLWARYSHFIIPIISYRLDPAIWIVRVLSSERPVRNLEIEKNERI